MKKKGYLNIIILLLVFLLGIASSRFFQLAKLSDISFFKKNVIISPKITVTPVLDITETPAPTPKQPQTSHKTLPDSGEPWGVAKKIGEHTYTVKLGHDERMGTANEIYEALNSYRSAHSRGYLAWDEKLAAYAQIRADHFKTIGTTDEHAGLNQFLESEDGFVKLGFNQIGENSYFGGPLYGVHIIEWLFASSAEHNSNQLDSSWSHVGIGVTNTSVNIIFGGGKM